METLVDHENDRGSRRYVETYHLCDGFKCTKVAWVANFVSGASRSYCIGCSAGDYSGNIGGAFYCFIWGMITKANCQRATKVAHRARHVLRLPSGALRRSLAKKRWKEYLAG